MRSVLRGSVVDTFQPLVTDIYGFAGLLDLLPVEAVAALVSLVTSLLLIFAVRVLQNEVPAPPASRSPESHVFRLKNGRVLPLSDDAGKFLSGGAEAKHGGLQDFIHAEGIPEAFQELESNGTTFSHEYQAPDGRAFDVSGAPAGAIALVTVTEIGAKRRQALELAAELGQERLRSQRVLQLLDDVPIPVWQLDGDRQLKWSNAACRDLDTDGDDGEILQALEANEWPEELPGPAVRIQVAGRNGTRWLEVSHHAFGPHDTVGLAIDVTPQVEAEASLSRFVETLTVTFAHLPIGLAIFDHERRLGMFNPALSDLLRLDAAWLAGQPSLREFLERLRENRQMPDQKDFVSWRRQLSALEEGAANGSYSEVWNLPSGQNFRVTGRPHPQGALAFLFEDISGAVQLEERRRAGNTLSQSLVDRLSEAIGVFDTSGRLSFCNVAFKTLWASGAPDLTLSPQIGAMVDCWQSRSESTGIWAELQNFASGATDRTSWSATVQLLGGPNLSCLFAPMPDGSTLTVFRAENNDPKPQIADNTEDHMTVLDRVETQEFFSGLEDILFPRGVRVDATRWNDASDLPAPTRGLRRIAWNMILAVVEFAPDAKMISISRDGMSGSVTIVAEPEFCGSVPAGEGGIAVRVLKQFVDRQGGTLTVHQPTAGQPFSIVCKLPVLDEKPGRISLSASSA